MDVSLVFVVLTWLQLTVVHIIDQYDVNICKKKSSQAHKLRAFQSDIPGWKLGLKEIIID